MNNTIPRHGGFRNLHSYRVARDIYDGTIIFCDKFVDRRSRTHDQMVQAARSGIQNIAEGSLAAICSKRTELKLTGVAKASLGELLLDFEHYLRQNGLRQWKKDDPEALIVRSAWRTRDSISALAPSPDPADPCNKYYWPAKSPEELANILICLINQASYLLWRQIKRLEDDFMREGNFNVRKRNWRY